MKKMTLGIVVLIGLIAGSFLLYSYTYDQTQADEEVTQDKELTQEQEQALVSVYINENISDLSPEPEVLGGTFYVTDIEFTNGNKGVVEYEDGHIALVADFEYSITGTDEIEVVLSNVREH